jgi:glutamate-1-semialdehyde 2,1-aminomutase
MVVGPARRAESGEAVTATIDTTALDALVAVEEARFLARTTRSRDLTEEARGALVGGVASSWQSAPPQALWVDHGVGSTIVDVDGTEYVDLHAGFGAMLVGHAHPAIVRAVSERVALGTHFAQPVPDAVVVAEELRRRFGLPQWRFGNSGTEATMDAVHLMRAVTGRDRIIKVEGSYHGHHDTVQVSVYPPLDEMGPADHPNAVVTGPAIPEAVGALVDIVPFGDLDAVAELLAARGGEIAGMILEPAMMNIGVIPPPDGYLAALVELLHAHGALVAFDEVKTGLTTGPGGLTARTGVTPDIVCLAKAMGGGLPCGAIGGTAAVMDAIETGTYEQVGTFNGNPLTMAAARATLTEILKPEAYAHLDALAARMRTGALDVLARHGIAGHVSDLGAKGCVVFRAEPLRNYRDFLDYDDRWGHAHWLFQHNRGVFLPPWGKCEQWTISVQHTTDDIDRFLANLDAFAVAVTSV